MTADEMKAMMDRESVSEWLQVTQEMIDRFADLTGDRQFIHVDPERARMTPFGGTIAHGFLTLSLVTQLASLAPDAPRLDGVRLALNLGGDRVRFLTPVPSGARIRGRFRVIEVEEKRAGRYHYTTAATIEIEGHDKPALTVDWISAVIV